MKSSGRYVTTTTAGEECKAFVPAPLPPDPALALNDQDQDLLEKANRALGRLDGLTALLPDISLFLYFYIRKEAILSSQIEGAQSSFSDLLMHEEDLALGVPTDDVQEVSSYVAALNHGLKRLREDDFPLSLRLICEMHEVLLAKGRGSDKLPGEFRRDGITRSPARGIRARKSADRRCASTYSEPCRKWDARARGGRVCRPGTMRHSCSRWHRDHPAHTDR